MFKLAEWPPLATRRTFSTAVKPESLIFVNISQLHIRTFNVSPSGHFPLPPQTLRNSLCMWKKRSSFVLCKQKACTCTESHQEEVTIAMIKSRELVLAASLILFPASSFALVSGFYDSAEKIQTILASEAVADAARQAPIGALSEVGKSPEGNSLWEVRVQECDLLVELQAILPDGPGKVTYEVVKVGGC